MANQALSRRQLMKSLSAAFVAPTILTSTYAGANDRIGIGMIGAGRQTIYSNLPFFLNNPDTQVLAVCEVDSWRLKNAVQKVNEHYGKQKSSGEYQGCDAYEDFRDLLRRDDIDAVMISTPDHWHVPMAVAAANTNKDICCEKPLTLCIKEGRYLSDLVAKKKRVFRTDSEFRSLEVFHRQCELVCNGRIGKLHTIKTGVPKGDVACPPQPDMPVPEELNYNFWLGPAPKAPYTVKRVHPREDYGRPGWMRVRDYCEGMITNWGAHLNDIAQWGNGTDRTGPVEIEGHGTYPEEGLWNVLLDFECHYRYANGVKLIYHIDHPYVRFEGEEGWIQADYSDRKLTASSKSILNSDIKEDEIHFPLKHEKQDFIDAIKTRGETLADAEVGHRTTSLCQLGHIAIQVGDKLEWDPDQEEFKNNEEATKLLKRTYRDPWKLTHL